MDYKILYRLCYFRTNVDILSETGMPHFFHNRMLLFLFDKLGTVPPGPSIKVGSSVSSFMDLLL